MTWRNTQSARSAPYHMEMPWYSHWIQQDSEQPFPLHDECFNVTPGRHIWVPRMGLDFTYAWKRPLWGSADLYNTLWTNFPASNGNVVRRSRLFVCLPAPSLPLPLFIYAHMQKNMRVKEKCQPYVTYMEISDSNSEFIVVLAVRTPSRPYFRVLDKSTCIPEIAVDFQYVWLIRYAICLLFSPVTRSWWQQTGILEMLVALQILALMPALGILELRTLLVRVRG